MSKTVRNTPDNRKNEQLARLNGMRGFKPLSHREREQQRERAFNAVYGSRAA